MKKQFFVIIILFVSTIAFSQDLIILKNDLRFENCKIIKEDSVNVYFKYIKEGIEIDTFTEKAKIQDYRYGKSTDNIIQQSILEHKTRSEFYHSRVQKYTQLKKTGTILGIGGGVFAATGILLASSADWQKVQSNGYSTNTTYETKDAGGFIGVLITVAGASVGITGIILASIGSRNAKKYQEKLNHISLNVICRPQQQGLSLTYRF
jgi:hypothetical protein